MRFITTFSNILIWFSIPLYCERQFQIIISNIWDSSKCILRKDKLMKYHSQRQHDTCLFQMQSQLRMNYLSVKREISRSPFHPIISIPLKIVSLHCVTFLSVKKLFHYKLFFWKDWSAENWSLKKKKDEPHFLWLGMHMDVIPSAVFVCVCGLCYAQAHHLFATAWTVAH